jgi:hypothetical protein
MRSLALLLCALLLGAAAAAHADSLSDLRRPSSAIPGCVNHWGLFGTGSGIAEPTCEGKVALAKMERARRRNQCRERHLGSRCELSRRSGTARHHRHVRRLRGRGRYDGPALPARTLTTTR